MSAIPVRIPTDKLERIDYLVKIGRFKNRSEALKFFISTSLEKEEIIMLEHDVDMKKIDELLDKIGNRKDLLTIESEKSAVEMVSEGRSR
jgi:Arc/MetJ-type ribon-helix-helix transcriptional regulator